MLGQKLNESKTVTIANGQSVSGSIDLERETLAGVLIPAAWTAAGISFLASPDGVTFGPVKDENGSEISLSALSAGDFVSLPPTKLFGARFLQVRSGTSGTPVAQGADRVLTLITRRL
jgi:hypothetical protein